MLAALLLFFTFSISSEASVCCGTSSAGVSEIRQQSQWSAEITYGIGDVSTIVDQNGIWRRTKEVNLQNLDLGATYALPRNLLLRSMIGIQQRRLTGGEASTLPTDLTLDLITPILDRTSIFFRVVAPTGRSSFDGNYSLAEVSGRGYIQAGLGLQRQMQISDLFNLSEIEVHQGLNKRFSDFSIRPGYGAGLSTLFKWRRWKLEPFASARLIYESPIFISDQNPHSTSLERSVVSAVGASWRLNSSGELSVSYSTQRWLGTPVNTALANILSVNFTALELSFNR